MTTDFATAPAPAFNPEQLTTAAAATDAPPAAATDAPPAPKPKRVRNRKRASDTAPKPTAAPRGAGRPSNASRREAKVLGLVGKVGATVYAVNEADGLVILHGATPLAAALAKLAEDSPSIAKVIDATLETGAWLEVLACVAAIAVPILANHGMAPVWAGAFLSPVPGATIPADTPADAPAAA
jgi:hypothetical protein